jgi:hypothetical protein
MSLCFLLLCFATSQAQPGDRKEKIEAFKVAFITQRLNLGTKEAQAFWPVYNEYLDKLEAARSLRSADLKNNRINPESLSDKDAAALLGNELLAREKEAQVTREYYEKFKTVLSVKKALLLFKAEDDFKRELLKQISGK